MPELKTIKYKGKEHTIFRRYEDMTMIVYYSFHYKYGIVHLLTVRVNPLLRSIEYTDFVTTDDHLKMINEMVNGMAVSA